MRRKKENNHGTVGEYLVLTVHSHVSFRWGPPIDNNNEKNMFYILIYIKDLKRKQRALLSNEYILSEHVNIVKQM